MTVSAMAVMMAYRTVANLIAIPVNIRATPAANKSGIPAVKKSGAPVVSGKEYFMDYYNILASQANSRMNHATSNTASVKHN